MPETRFPHRTLSGAEPPKSRVVFRALSTEFTWQQRQESGSDVPPTKVLPAWGEQPVRTPGLVRAGAAWTTAALSPDWGLSVHIRETGGPRGPWRGARRAAQPCAGTTGHLFRVTR